MVGAELPFAGAELDVLPAYRAPCARRRAGAGLSSGGADNFMPSCPGLTRASMMRVSLEESYVSQMVSERLMDCRVKPGNDSGGVARRRE
jgi:hypothetical protein